MNALGGGFGNVLGPLVQMLSHSSVEYSRAASRDRRDGCASRRATAEGNSVEGATWAEESEQKRESSIFRTLPTSLRKSAGWVTPNQTLTTLPPHTPSHSLCTLHRQCEHFHFKQTQAYSLKGRGDERRAALPSAFSTQLPGI